MDTTLDRLAGAWHIYQLRRGHRLSTDDTAAAWAAARALPGATRLLDMGCGIGSVGLLTLWQLGESAHLTGVEAQDISVSLARRTVEHNGLAERVHLVHGDLRDPEVLPASSQFELVTGSPPYIPLGKGVVSPNPQRAAARMELRGSIFDYCEAARRWLAPGGRFVFVMAAKDQRTEQAPAAHGFTVLERTDWVFRYAQGPHIATMVCAREEDGPHSDRVHRDVVVRGEDGRWTEDYLAFRRHFGAEV